MKKLLLMLLWPPAVFMTYPPIHASGKESKEVKPAVTMTLAQEIMDSDAEVTAEDAQTKRTDVKKIMGYTTVTKINGNPAICDMCGEPATNFWVDAEAGCAWARCEKHK